MSTLSLSQEFEILTQTGTKEVMKAVFKNLSGYKVARQNDSYEDFLNAMKGIGSRK
jgi:hypothetical protein